MADLDTLVERARGATVRAGPADAYVRELARWASPAPRRWLPWLVAGATAAAAVIAIALWPHDAPTIEIAVRTVHVDVPAAPIMLGDRVAIVVEPGTEFRVLRATGDDTGILVERGVVTARLFHGTPHSLRLVGGGLVATATGTVYSLSVGRDGAVVHVDQGTVTVNDALGSHEVKTGAGWALDALAVPVGPSSEGAPSPDAAAALMAMPAPPPITAEPPRPHPPAPTHSAPPPPPQESPKDRWRRARLFRSQGKLADAIAECNAIADTNDATWAPIALVEAARIYLGPLGDPEHAIATADRMIAAWPAASLVGEAREIRCRALTQLGRGAECAARSP